MGEFRPNWLGNLKHNQESQHAAQWSFSPGYKCGPSYSEGLSPQDSLNPIYTSDYGSYSSQESNHSGNSAIYSNFADCEEALNNLRIPYDFSPPSLVQSQKMSSRKPKPLPPVPPPRRDSRIHLREKKISFDDTAVINGRLPGPKKEDNVPSFATLPRKKKPVPDSICTTPSRSGSQVTWMKEIAQRAEVTLRDSKAPIAPPKATHGILKNSSALAVKPDTPKSSYINRNTVQKILDQQRKAISKNAANSTASGSQFYKSMSNLKPSPSAKPPTSRTGATKKPWEYNSKSLNFTSTAQVLGVIEPLSSTSSAEAHHVKQNSAETEFEFPPPPSDTDIAQLLSPPAGVCIMTNGYHYENHMKGKTTPHRAESAPHTIVSSRQLRNNSNINSSAIDVVLPPPPEFQGPTKPAEGFMSQQTYGDYELLSPDAGYDYNPWNTQHVHNGQMLNSNSGYRSKGNIEGCKHQPQSKLINGIKSMRNNIMLNHTNQPLNKAYSIVRHSQQYSTEL